MAHHCSASRLIEWGDAASDVCVGLPCGLPVKAYVLQDMQSDRAALQLLTPAFYPERWDAFGCHMMMLVSALLSAAWEAGSGLTAVERFRNCTLCYFLILLNRCRAALVHGTEWKSRFLPQVTIKNMCHGCVFAMQLAMHLPRGARCDPHAFGEKVIEQHFGRIKSGWKGTPSIRDGVLSTCRLHLENCRRPLLLPDTVSSTITQHQAERLLDESYQDAVLLQSWITVDQSAAQITKGFDAWFKKNGRSLLASAKTSDQELDDEDAGYNEELDEEGDAAPPLGEPDSAELLDAVSDHLKQRLEIHKLAEEINAGTPAPVATDAAELAEEVSAGTPAPVAADATDALVPVADTGSEVTAASAKPIAGDDAESQQGQLVLEQGEHAEDPEPAPNTFHALIVACKKNELFDMDTEKAKTNVGCRDRQLFLMPLIRRFTAAVRLREQHLSKATILRDREHTMSEYHALHHELARARNAILSDGSRQSRARSWQLTQLACFEAVESAATQGSEWHVREVERLRSGEGDTAQLVVFRSDDPETGLHVPKLAWVRGVFRGAVPCIHGLTPTLCSRVRLMVLTKFDDSHYFCSSFNEMVVVDPLHSVIAEARIREQTEVQSRLIFALYDGAVKAIKAWEANPALLKDTAGNAAGGDSEADVPPPVQRYAWSDFGRSKDLRFRAGPAGSVSGPRAQHHWRRWPHQLHEAEWIQVQHGLG